MGQISVIVLHIDIKPSEMKKIPDIVHATWFIYLDPFSVLRCSRPNVEIAILKTKRSSDRLIFVMEILILIR